MQRQKPYSGSARGVRLSDDPLRALHKAIRETSYLTRPHPRPVPRLTLLGQRAAAVTRGRSSTAPILRSGFLRKAEGLSIPSTGCARRAGVRRLLARDGQRPAESAIPCGVLQSVPSSANMHIDQRSMRTDGKLVVSYSGGGTIGSPRG